MILLLQFFIIECQHLEIGIGNGEGKCNMDYPCRLAIRNPFMVKCNLMTFYREDIPARITLIKGDEVITFDCETKRREGFYYTPYFNHTYLEMNKSDTYTSCTSLKYINTKTMITMFTLMSIMVGVVCVIIVFYACHHYRPPSLNEFERR